MYLALEGMVNVVDSLLKGPERFWVRATMKHVAISRSSVSWPCGDFMAQSRMLGTSDTFLDDVAVA